MKNKLVVGVIKAEVKAKVAGKMQSPGKSTWRGVPGVGILVFEN